MKEPIYRVWRVRSGNSLMLPAVSFCKPYPEIGQLSAVASGPWTARWTRPGPSNRLMVGNERTFAKPKCFKVHNYQEKFIASHQGIWSVQMFTSKMKCHCCSNNSYPLLSLNTLSSPNRPLFDFFIDYMRSALTVHMNVK